MRQWMLRITAYAEKLLTDLDTIDWSDSLKEMQRNWIGRSEGAEVDFQIARVTRKDPVSSQLVRTRCLERLTWCSRRNIIILWLVFRRNYSEDMASKKFRMLWKGSATTPSEGIQNYQDCAAKKSDLERTELAKEKTGIFTGAYAINPVNGEKIPIWIADYVLASYGTGAIMAVPAHDKRDYEFATKFSLPIVQVVQPPDSKTDWQRVCRRWHFCKFNRNKKFRSPVCRPPKPKRKSPTGSKKKISARKPSITSCATGCSAGSVTGASRSRLSGRRCRRESLSRSVARIRVAGFAANTRRLQTHARRPAASRPRGRIGSKICPTFPSA